MRSRFGESARETYCIGQVEEWRLGEARRSDQVKVRVTNGTSQVEGNTDRASPVPTLVA